MREAEPQEGDGDHWSDRRLAEVFATVREAIRVVGQIGMVLAFGVPLYFLSHIFTPFAGVPTEVGVRFDVGLAIPGGLAAALLAVLERSRRRGKQVERLQVQVRELQEENSSLRTRIENLEEKGQHGDADGDEGA